MRAIAEIIPPLFFSALEFEGPPVLPCTMPRRAAQALGSPVVVKPNRMGPPSEKAAKPSLFANRDFRLLFIGSSISVLGDQFTLLALPWLVLKLTGDPQQLGFVLALMALPLAVFLLVGGAVVDRMSPRKVLLNSRSGNASLIRILAGP